ncbi:unnamed protein product [Polarella glacialis]|uniref:Uncharacterized protein n=1 Tax=Polarella glacialis TaxID=89957 RepID=A0A813L7A3_POLGL|nr:unnamed protein product [Polarella glacialis]
MACIAHPGTTLGGERQHQRRRLQSPLHEMDDGLGAEEELQPASPILQPLRQPVLGAEINVLVSLLTEFASVVARQLEPVNSSIINLHNNFIKMQVSVRNDIQSIGDRLSVMEVRFDLEKGSH